MIKSKGTAWVVSRTLLMSSESWKRRQSDGTMYFDSGIAYRSLLEVRRIGMVLGFGADDEDGPASAWTSVMVGWEIS